MEEKVETVPSKPENSVPFFGKHVKLIHLMKALNYIGSERGTCEGIAYMGMQAVFTNELEGFNQRVNRLLEIPLDDFKKTVEALLNNGAKGTEKTLLRGILEDYLRSKDLLIDTLAFFDGVELHQQRILYPHLFDGTEPLTQGSFVKLTIPQKLKDQGEIVSLPQHLSGVYKQDELATDYFALLREKINIMVPKPTEPICLSISGFGLQHAIVVSYDPQHDKWTLIDANTPPSQEYTDDAAIAGALIKACSKNEIAAIHTQVYTFAGNEYLERVLMSWMQEVQNRAKRNIENKAQWSDSYGGTWLIAAIRAKNYELIPHLIAHGAYVNKPRDTDNCTPLTIAVLLKNRDSVELLLKNGADPNFRTGPYALTSFEHAITTNDYNLVKLMLEHGAKLAKNPYGKLNVNTAIEKGHLESLKAILEHGFEPNAIAPEDDNPLLWAVKNAQFEAARLLLEYGADPEQEDDLQRKSARQFAEENNLKEFLELFNNPPPRKEITHEQTTQKEALSSDNDHAINDFIDDLKKYCQTRRAEWSLPKWMHVNEKSAQYKTNLITLKFGFSVEDKIKAAEKLIAALENKKARERLTDFDIAALLNSRLYSTVVKKYERLFDQVEEVQAYKNKAEQLVNTPQNPAA
ncbi:ankyrin repeat domain-containing protein [Legionella bozemanae]|uniref:ankyrin repeat domain-containing protein n=1 Tax=Legionella bozemanae TaxID=447 RepID=UPI003EEEBED0